MGSGKGKKIILGILMFILLGIMILLLDKDNQIKFRELARNVGIGNKEFNESISLAMEDEAEDFAAYDDGVMVWGNSKLIKFKMDGSKEWERILNLNHTEIVFGKENIYLYDGSTGDIHILSQEGETIKRINLEAEIKGVTENFQTLMVHVKKSDDEGIIVLDYEGKIIEENLVKGENLLTYSLNKDKDTYVLSLLDLGEKGIASQVRTFGMSSKLLSDTFIQDEIVMYCKFIKEDILLLMSDSGLYCIQGDKILWSRKLKSISDIDVGDKEIYVIHGKGLETISFDGELLYRYSFSKEYNRVISYRKDLILYGNEDIIGLRKNKEIFQYRSEGDIVKVQPVNNKLIIRYKDRIDIIS